MKRSRLRQVGKKKSRLQKLHDELHCDAHGIAFAASQMQGNFLPPRVSDWRKVGLVKSDEALHFFGILFTTIGGENACWNCGKRGDLWQHIHIHHIAHVGGRADELCNFAALCGGCHDEAHGGKLSLGRVLYLKWKYDRPHTDWVRITQLMRRWLPDLVLDETEIP